MHQVLRHKVRAPSKRHTPGILRCHCSASQRGDCRCAHCSEVPVETRGHNHVSCLQKGTCALPNTSHLSASALSSQAPNVTMRTVNPKQMIHSNGARKTLELTKETFTSITFGILTSILILTQELSWCQAHGVHCLWVVDYSNRIPVYAPSV